MRDSITRYRFFSVPSLRGTGRRHPTGVFRDRWRWCLFHRKTWEATIQAFRASVEDTPLNARLILLIRGQKVILDRDLAALYGVTTKRLNEQVKRNRDRFLEDFMFRLSSEEGEFILASRSQIATLKRGQNLKYAWRSVIDAPRQAG